MEEGFVFRSRAMLVGAMLLTLLLVFGVSNAPLAAQGPAPEEGVQARQWKGTRPSDPLALSGGMSNEPCVDGMAGGMFACQGIDLLAWIPLEELGATENPSGNNGNDIWGWTDPESGTEYVLIGHSSGSTFVDISDPINPVVVGVLPPNAPYSFNHLWGDMKVYENTMYHTAEADNEGVQVFDLTQLRDATPGTTFAQTALYDQLGNAHNIALNTETGFAYAVGAGYDGADVCTAGGGQGGLHMIDVSDPLNPTLAGCFYEDGYTHDTQCVIYTGPDADYQGQELCFAANEDTVTVVDVTDKANPLLISRQGYDTSAYVHQGWLTEDQRYFLQDDELDEYYGNVPGTTTYIWDMLDLDNPVLIGTYDPGINSIDHNLFIVGNLAYEANYTSGLRVLDISDVANANLTEIAYFDTFPEGDFVDFGGAWGNYPFFESGVIAVSDFNRGLFLLRLNSEVTAVTVDGLAAGSAGVGLLPLALAGGLLTVVLGAGLLRRKQA